MDFDLEEVMLQAKAHAETAIQYNPQSPDAHVLLGFIRACFLEWDAAERAFQTAVRSLPNHLRTRFMPSIYAPSGHLTKQKGLPLAYSKNYPSNPVGPALHRLFPYIGGEHFGPYHWDADDRDFSDHLIMRLTSDFYKADVANFHPGWFPIEPFRVNVDKSGDAPGMAQANVSSECEDRWSCDRFFPLACRGPDSDFGESLHHL